MLSLDAMDLSGAQHVNIQHNIYKRKLDINGYPMEEPERQESEYISNPISLGRKSLLKKNCGIRGSKASVIVACQRKYVPGNPLLLTFQRLGTKWLKVGPTILKRQRQQQPPSVAVVMEQGKS